MTPRSAGPSRSPSAGALETVTQRQPPQAFADVFDAEFPGVYRYIRRRVGEGRAEDLASETFLVAYRRWDRFDSNKPVRPWLYGIATNLVRHYRRSEVRQLRAYARTGVDPVTTGIEEEAIGHVEGARLGRSLAACLAELRPSDRDILLLRAWADLTDQEIAAAMSLPIGTVKSRLSRVRDRIRGSLEQLPSGAAGGQIGEHHED